MAKIELEIYEFLPCSCRVFKVNGIPADVDDFGESWTSGDPSIGSCYHRFNHGFPTAEVLEKYGITLEEFREICEKLESELYVGGCGYCW